MLKNARGFTIVELLIVIVVIGILAAITVVAFNGIQVRAQNTARLQEIKSWQKHFELYKVQYGNYPIAVEGGYCLGTGFPTNASGVAQCRDYKLSATGYPESGSVDLMNELRKVGSLPSGTRQPAANRDTVGPYAVYAPTEIYLYAVLEGKDNTVCAPGTNLTWTDGVNRAICRVVLIK